MSRDPDGVESLDIVGYQWQTKSPSAKADWQDIKDASEAYYDIPISTDLAPHTQYRLRLIYRDGQGYSNTIVSGKFTSPILDLDRDDDGLIEIRYLEDLAAMYYERSGNAYRESFDMPRTTRGCPANSCRGYELLRDLDFNDDGSYRDLSNKRRWAEIGRWLYPSSRFGSSSFEATFEGNGYTISNFKIRETGAGVASLFGHVAGKIANLGLLNVDVLGDIFVGGLAGVNEGTIANCYVTGNVASTYYSYSQNSQIGGLVGWHVSLAGDSLPLIINSYANVSIQGNVRHAGGLVGRNKGRIINSYAVGDVKGNILYAGGLVGFNEAEAAIVNAYAIGDIRGTNLVGGLVGHSDGIVKHSFAATKLSSDGSIGGLIGSSGSAAQSISSYWDSLIGNIHHSAGGTSKTTIELQTSNADESTIETDIYYGWRRADWDFGSNEQYPILRYAQTSDAHQDFTACINTANDDSALPVCGTHLPDRKRGLSDLTILAEGNLSLSTIFRGSLKDYELMIASRQDRFNIIATAVEASTLIDISVNGEIIDEGIASGVASSDILLNSEGLTRVVVIVRAQTRDRYTFDVSYIPFEDLDEDDNGLIEIRKLEDLNAIRYNLYGTAYQASPDTAEFTTGCPPQGCRGYELIADLDFQDDASYRRIENKAIWTAGAGWQPIGSEAQPFKAIFRGNIKAIYGLLINRPDVDDVGLFGAIGEGAEIDGVDLLRADVLGKLHVGGLVGISFSSTISNSYVSGHIKAEGGADSSVGGLVGVNRGIISNTRAAGSVLAKGATISAGGLVGRNAPGGAIFDSYATGRVEGGRDTGGLVGTNQQAIIARSYATVFSVSGNMERGGLVANNDSGSISDSYWNVMIAGIEDAETTRSISNGATGLVSEQLKAPTMPGSTLTEVYFNWSTDNWDFGTPDEYPALKYNHPGLQSTNRCTVQHSIC